MRFGQILKALRRERGFTQKQLADTIGAKESSIRDWELRGRQPRYETLCEIAAFFNVTVGQLLGTEEL